MYKASVHRSFFASVTIEISQISFEFEHGVWSVQPFRATCVVDEGISVPICLPAETLNV